MFWGKKKKEKQAQKEAELKQIAQDALPEGVEAEVPTQAIESPVVEDSPVIEAPIIEEAQEAPKQGWLSRLTSGLTQSTGKMAQGLNDFVTKRKLDDAALEELEEMLISADLGPHTAAKIIEDFSKERFGKEVDQDEIKTALAQQMAEILEPVTQELKIEKPENGPFVILMCGVNGAGKTTTIGKMAEKLMAGFGYKVMVAAGDTFRAAAVEQLQTWAKRSGALFYAKGAGADAASVAYEAYTQALDAGVDVLLIDTAGRLQNKANLMEELQKIIRVLKKRDETLPHASVLVLDATTGQNAFSQVEIFREMVNVSGLIVTKLDGSAKGGVLVGLAERYQMPVYAIGVGEGLHDLQSFNADDYARALMGI